MTNARDWLAARLAEAPNSLRTSVERAAFSEQRAADAGQFADALKAAAEQLKAAVPPLPAGPHGAALDLLTADALITLACEWVAERNPAALEELR